jgi:hypothetical protein
MARDKVIFLVIDKVNARLRVEVRLIFSVALGMF